MQVPSPNAPESDAIAPIGEMRTTEARPRGHDEIVRAVVRAATQLFADRGPGAVSLRDVAAQADVTLSQIHRHVGSNADLLAAVLEADLAGQRLFDGDDEDVPIVAWLRSAFQPRFPADTRTRLHARTILDGFELPQLQARFPGIERTAELLRTHLPDDQARVRAALLASFFAGWRLFGDTYLRVTQAPDTSPERLAAIIEPMLDAMATAPAGSDR
jgi:AcrR family transcriptional regulator